MKKFLAMMLALVMALSLVACGNQAAPDADTDDNSDAPAELTYAVEAGSAVFPNAAVFHAAGTIDCFCAAQPL